MAEEEGVVVGDATLFVVEVCVADTAGVDFHDDIVGAWVWKADGLPSDGGVLSE